MKKLTKIFLVCLLAFSVTFVLASCDTLKKIPVIGDLIGNVLGDEPGEEPGGDTPGGDTPGTDTPGTDTPGTDTPGTDTPGSSLPDVSWIQYPKYVTKYNGTQKSHVISTTLPKGVTVEYENNAHVIPGEYETKVKFFYEGVYMEGFDKTSMMVIEQGEYKMKENYLPFEGKTVDYDGELHQLTYYTPPAYTSLKYHVEGEAAKDAGEYVFKVVFENSDPYYNDPEPFEAVLTINKISYTEEQLGFTDRTVVYNGEAQTVTPETLPLGVLGATYEIDAVNAGEYDLVATIVYDTVNCDGPATVTRKLTIQKKVYTKADIPISPEVVTFDGNVHTLSLTADLPAGITSATFVGEGGRDAGVYPYTLNFVYDEANCSVENMELTLEIEKVDYSNYNFDLQSKTVYHTGDAYSIVYDSLPVGVTATYTGNGQSEVGEYQIRATLNFETNNCIPPRSRVKTAVLKIVKFSLDDVVTEDRVVNYNGNEQTYIINSPLPAGVSAQYENARHTNAGEYVVTIKFYKDGEHLVAYDRQVKLVIQKANYNMSSITFSDKTVAYDGNAHTIEVSGNLPTGLFVSYTGGNKTYVGTHTMYAIFSTADPNYNAPAPMKATLNIIGLPAASNGFEYNLKADGTYEIVGYTGTDTYVVLPGAYEGKAVTSVASYAFEGKAITAVHIPDSITNIGNKAFNNCSALEFVYIGNSVEVIGSYAFANTALVDVDLPKSLEVIGASAFRGVALESITVAFVGGSKVSSSDYFGYIFGASNYASNASYVPASLKRVVIAGSCTKIPAYSFYGCKNITEIVIENGVEHIGNSAFSGCTSITSIYIPVSVSEIPANVDPTNSPFYKTSESLLIVMGGVPTSQYGKYWNYTTKTQASTPITMKTYEEYQANMDVFVSSDPKDATLAGIVVGNNIISTFNPDTYKYTVKIDVNKDFPIVSAGATSGTANVNIVQASVNNPKAVITVTSFDGTVTLVYEVNFEIIGSFEAESEVVLKNGAEGAVSFVIDDGVVDTAKKAVEFQKKYRNLKFTFAIPTKTFATLNTERNEQTGLLEYVKDADGNYVYETRTSNLNTWLSLMLGANGKYNDIASHTHTNAYWGTDNNGGNYEWYDKNGEYQGTIELPVGEIEAQYLASKQILDDLFGHLPGQYTVAMINAGINAARSDINGVKSCFQPFYDNLKDVIATGDYVGSRTTGSFTSSNAKNCVITVDKLKTKRIELTSFMVNSTNMGANGGTEYAEAVIDAAIQLGGWSTFCIHTIDGTYHMITSAQADAIFAHADSYGDRLWIAGYGEALLYFSELGSAKSTVTYDGTKVTVSVTDNEDNTVYNAPLTVKVKVPGVWNRVVVNGTVLEVKTDKDGTQFVYVDVVPDSGSVEITPFD